MESIIKCVHHILLRTLPAFDLSSLSGKGLGKLRLTPEELLRVIHAQALAEWSLRMAAWFSPRRIKNTHAGRPVTYQDSSILLMAVVQTIWRKSYEQIIDFVASNPGLAQQLGFCERTISKGQYWE